jgi:hypothetical protein
MALERLTELETFNRLAVGRELKMFELKREIEDLKVLLPAYWTELSNQR